MVGAVIGMLGAGGAPGLVTVSGEAVNGASSNPTPAQATIQFTLAGIVNKVENGVSTQVDTTTDWVRPAASAPGLYEIRATLNSGTSPSGSAVGSFIALTSTRAWTLDQAVVGSVTCNLTIAIRYNGGAILSSNTYSLTATVV